FYWEPLEEQYPESRKLEEFFRFYLAVKTYDLYSRKDVYEGFKKYWSHRSEDTETKLREINRYCRYYHDIYEGHCENADAEKALADFRRSDYRMPAPFLMEMYRLFDEGMISSREFAAQVRLIDSYMIRRALCGIDTSPLARYFPSLLRAVMSAYNRGGRSDIIAITRECLITYNRGKPLAMPTDKELKAKMREINAYSLMCLRPVLDRLEHHGSHARVDLSELNIEHIMPQHPNNWWKKNCGAETDDDYTFHANLIGNLTLCAEYDNSRMGNEDFAYKKKVLAATSHIRLNENLLKMKHWTVEDILKRCDELAVRIIEIYPYNGANNEGVRRTVQVTSKDIIVLNTPTVSARAFYHHNNDIEILSGTMMKAYQETDMKKFLAVFRDLYDREILKEMDGGKVVFESSAHFASLSEAASFLMHRGGDNRSAWTYEDGSEIQDKPMPEKKPEKKVMKKTAQHARKAIAARKAARKASAVRKTVKKAEPEAPRKVEVRRFEKKTEAKEEA
ncbi:MAG: HNH endonuclease, partial [Solobacterium sp.]|nr:HNH endonuclease [Solobacterium sp.]